MVWKSRLTSLVCGFRYTESARVEEASTKIAEHPDEAQHRITEVLVGFAALLQTPYVCRTLLIDVSLQILEAGKARHKISSWQCGVIMFKSCFGVGILGLPFD